LPLPQAQVQLPPWWRVGRLAVSSRILFILTLFNLIF
jgi:hypothetical protein